MSRFLKLERLDPYRLFGAVVRRSRLGMKAAFDEAFAAHTRCTDLLKEHQWLSFDERKDVFGALHSSRNLSQPALTRADLDQMYLDAQAEDLQADYQASIVILFADDALQHLAKGLLGKAPGLHPGYGGAYNGVPLTTLLRAGTNALRHVSEWDDGTLPFPYPDLLELRTKAAEKTATKEEREWLQQMESIAIIQQAFGIGKHERVRDVVSMRIIIAVDGHLGSPDGPNYARFEDALMRAAFDVAAETERRKPQEDAAAKLRAAL